MQLKNFNKSLFKKPPIEYSVIPFWFINKIVDKKELHYQINEMQKKEVNAFFIHARRGLEIPDYIKEPRMLHLGNITGGLVDMYLTKERKIKKLPYLDKVWFRITDEIIKYTKGKNFNIWLYDELDWPSGTAGCKIPVKYKQLAHKYLKISIHSIRKEYQLPDNVKYAYVIEDEKIKKIKVKGSIKLNPNQKLVIVTYNETDDYIDVLNKESANKFIELTHEKYKKRYKKEFGKLIKGMFSDEVTLLHHFLLPKVTFQKLIPYTDNLEKVFFEEYNYKLEDKLPLLLLDLKGYEKFRYDFWQLITRLYKQNFHERIKNWCNENNLLYTGHVLMEEPSQVQLQLQGNIFEILRSFTLPGIDHLGKRCDDIHPRIASSVSHFIDSNCCLCETYGASGKEINKEELIRIANWLYVNGINLLTPHAFYLSTDGIRKYDYPPSQFLGTKIWDEYKEFAVYIKRLSYFTRLGKHSPDVAIYYPIETLFALFNLSLYPSKLHFIFNEIKYICSILSMLHYDYDLIDNVMLAEAQFKKGKMIIKNEHYKAIILPATAIISKNIKHKLTQAIKNNVRIIATSILPTASIDEDDITSWVRNTFHIIKLKKEDIPRYYLNPHSITQLLNFISPQFFTGRIDEVLSRLPISTITNIYENKNSIFIKTNKLGLLPTYPNLSILKNVFSFIEKDIEIISKEGRIENLGIFKMKTNNERLYLIVNHSNKSIIAHFLIKDAKEVNLLDFKSGKIKKLDNEFELQFEKYQAIGVMKR